MATIAMLVGEGFEDSEVAVPRAKLTSAGHKLTIIGPQSGETLTGKKGATLAVEQALEEVVPSAFDALLIPGGKGPENLLDGDESEQVVRWVQDFAATGRPIAAICHGPLLLAAADLIDGRSMTSWPKIEDELVDAGANWIDAEVVEDGQFITSRKPADLEAFSTALIERLHAGHAKPAGDEGEPRIGVRHAQYGRQTHGGQDYGESGKSGQPVPAPKRAASTKQPAPKQRGKARESE